MGPASCIGVSREATSHHYFSTEHSDTSSPPSSEQQQQKVNSAPTHSAISEQKEREHPQRTAELGNALPKNIKCPRHEDMAWRKGGSQA